MYIYTITNKLNNNVYVGQTIQKNVNNRPEKIRKSLQTKGQI